MGLKNASLRSGDGSKAPRGEARIPRGYVARCSWILTLSTSASPRVTQNPYGNGGQRF
jgi:hypothetical protein